MMLVRLAVLPLLVQAANILQSNDDGWAEINIRTFYDALGTANHSLVISAPAIDRSGTGSTDKPAETVGASGCEFNSCPAGSPAEGNNASNTRINYVNAYPVTSVKYGLTTLSPRFFNGTPDIVVAGPNVGLNTGGITQISGTVGAASYAASVGVPAVAFSGASGTQTGWEVNPVPDYSTIYATLAANVTNALLASGTPYLPNGTFLNVNFPQAGSGTNCTAASAFKFVLTRITASQNASDVQSCGNNTLPAESVVINSGCYASISVGDAKTKSDSTRDAQTVVSKKLNSILSCMSNSTSTSPSGSTPSSSAGYYQGPNVQYAGFIAGVLSLSLAV